VALGEQIPGTAIKICEYLNGHAASPTSCEMLCTIFLLTQSVTAREAPLNLRLFLLSKIDWWFAHQ
jgi:hypothetical protein